MDACKLDANSGKVNFSALDLDAAEPTCCGWALAYAAVGLRVFPVKANKEPIWDPGLGLEHGFKDATTDAELIRRRWEKYPFADIGCAIPSDIVVLDLDRGDSEDGFRDFLTRAGQATDKVETPQCRPRPRRSFISISMRTVAASATRFIFDGTAMDVRTHCITLPSPRSGREWIKPLTRRRCRPRIGSPKTPPRKDRRGSGGSSRARHPMRSRRAKAPVPISRTRRTKSRAIRYGGNATRLAAMSAAANSTRRRPSRR